MLDEQLKPSIELIPFQHLENATLVWHKKYMPSLFELPVLRKLKLRNFDCTDCLNMSAFLVLEDLTLIQCKNFSAKGLENIKTLKSLNIVNNRKLRDVDDLSNSTSLTSLKIDLCPTIELFDWIGGITTLERLEIVNVKGVFSCFSWVHSLPNLKHVISEAKVLEIDWEIIFQHSFINEFTTATHKGYQINDDHFMDLATKYGRVIKSIERYPPKNNPMISIVFDK